MASNSKKTKAIRANKAKPNKRNLKADQKRIAKNARILQELAAQDESARG